jgi:hypothetical protein
MNQLVIRNLEFCKSNNLHKDQVKGGFVDFDFTSLGEFAFSPAGSAAAGAGAAVAVAIGENDPIVFTFVTQ